MSAGSHVVAVAVGAVAGAVALARYLGLDGDGLGLLGRGGRNLIGLKDPKENAGDGSGDDDAPPQGWRRTDVEHATYEAGRAADDENAWFVVWHSEAAPGPAVRAEVGQYARFIWAPVGAFGLVKMPAEGSVAVLVDGSYSEEEGVKIQGATAYPDVAAASEAQALVGLRAEVGSQITEF